jgi:Double zinc ribbon
MECPQCRASNPDSKRFCSDCGSPLVLTCLSCGAPSVPGKKFCGDCGTPFSLRSAVASDTEAAPRPAGILPAGDAPLPSATSSAGAERRQLTVVRDRARRGRFRIAAPGSSCRLADRHGERLRSLQRKPSAVFTERWISRASRAQSSSSFARRRASRGFGATRAGMTMLALFSRQRAKGSSKDCIRPISKPHGWSSKSSAHDASPVIPMTGALGPFAHPTAPRRAPRRRAGKFASISCSGRRPDRHR